MMAEAYGKLTGRPGVCLVTRGPGATNGSSGVHIAFQDSTPLMLLIGQVGARDASTARRSRRSTTGACSAASPSGSPQIDAPSACPSCVRAAPSRPRRSGRPGPVVLALPEDMLVEAAAAADAPPQPVAGATRRQRTSRSLRHLLAGAPNGRSRSSAAAAGIASAARRHPARSPKRTTAGRRLVPPPGLFRQPHRPATPATSASASTRGSRERVRDADLLLRDRRPALARASTVELHAVDVPVPEQTAGPRPSRTPRSSGRVYSPILRSAPACAQLRRGAARALEPVDSQRLARADPGRARAISRIARRPRPTPGDLQLGEVVAWLRDTLPEDAIVTNGAGNFTVWVTGFYTTGATARSSARRSGSMGYGTARGDRREARGIPSGRWSRSPATAIPDERPGARDRRAVRAPRIVVSWSTTACTGRSGCTRSATIPGRGRDRPQEPGLRGARPRLRRPRRGGRAHRGLRGRLPGAEAAGTFALLDLRVDPEAITPRATLSPIREQALAGQ